VNLLSEKRFDELTKKMQGLEPILVVGDVGLDKYTQGEVRRISPEAPVPVIEVTREWLKLGLAANISHNLKTLGVTSTLCGVVGNDHHAGSFEHLLEDEGLSTWGLVRSDKRPTIFKERVTTATQQICRIDYESTEPLHDEEATRLVERVREFGAKASAVILEDYAKGTLSESVLRDCIAEARAQKLMVSVDPGRTTPPLWYKGASLLKPNRLEAGLMVESLGHGYKKLNLEQIATILVEALELEKIVITLGKDGMALLDTKGDGKLQQIPTAASEVFDVSGAGDTAISLLIAALGAGATLDEAAWIANCGAGVVVGKVGTATVDQKELRRFYLKLKETLG